MGIYNIDRIDPTFSDSDRIWIQNVFGSWSGHTLPDPQYKVEILMIINLQRIFDDFILKQYFQIALIVLFVHLIINEFNYKIIRHLIFIDYFTSINLICFILLLSWLAWKIYLIIKYILAT